MFFALGMQCALNDKNTRDEAESQGRPQLVCGDPSLERTTWGWVMVNQDNIGVLTGNCRACSVQSEERIVRKDP